jgi:hypothetical protein
MLSEAFVSVLSVRRAEYNAQFLAARRAAPELDEEAFKAFLATSVEPLVSAVALVDKAALVEVVDVAYGVGLELLAQRLAGPRAHVPALDIGFQQLFPALASFIARAPAVLLPRLCNALQQLSSVPGARPEDWCRALSRLASNAENVEQLLGLGQVLAWLAGLAHYRSGALLLCLRLPQTLVSNALGVPGEELERTLSRLQQDPWFVPSAPKLGFRVVGGVGSFRGFGGAFLSPPRVVRVGQQLFVQSGDDSWLLALDAFGCTFHRVQAEELAGASSDIERVEVSIDAKQVSAFGQRLPLADTGPLTSVVGNATTLLFTTAHSYAVIVVALQASP